MDFLTGSNVRVYEMNSSFSPEKSVFRNGTNVDSSIDAAAQNVHAEKVNLTTVVIMAVVLVVIFIASMTGNTFVCLIFYKKPALLTVSNRFILNLSICNTFETVFIMPFMFSSLVYQEWVFGQFWCQATGFLMNTIFAASTLTLVVIAIDRYCAVVTPLHYAMRITSKRAVAMTISIWAVAILCSVPPLLGWNRYEFQPSKSACMTVSASRRLNDRSFSFFLVTLCFILPLIIIVWTYSVMFRAARTNSEKVRRNSCLNVDDVIQTPIRQSRRSSTAPILVHRLSITGRSNSLLWRRDEWKSAVTSCIVISTFIICWLLYFIIIILECFLENPSSIKSVIKVLSILLAMSNCALNPMVYVFRGKVQRQQLKIILGIEQQTNTFCIEKTIHKSRCLQRQKRQSLNPLLSRETPNISRQGSEESDIVPGLHHVTTTTTLTSMVVLEEHPSRNLSRI